MEVWQTSNLRRLRLGEERKKEEEETTGQKCNGLPCYIGDHKQYVKLLENGLIDLRD